MQVIAVMNLNYTESMLEKEFELSQELDSRFPIVHEPRKTPNLACLSSEELLESLVVELPGADKESFTVGDLFPSSGVSYGVAPGLLPSIIGFLIGGLKNSVIGPLNLVSRRFPGRKNKGLKKEDLLKIFNQVKEKSFPGSQALENIDEELKIRFDSLVDYEEVVFDSKNKVRKEAISDIVLMTSIRIEHILKILLFLSSLPIIDNLCVFLDNKQINILQKAVNENKPTLGIIHLISIAASRGLKRCDLVIRKWFLDNFNEPVCRYEGEIFSVVNQFRAANFPLFVGELRSKYRNPAAHGELTNLELSDYSDFCDLVFASTRIRYWMDIGVNPSIYAPRKTGWLSVLVHGAKNKTIEKP